MSLEDKIRHVCKSLPTLEWSGTLFYTVKGSFEGKDLVITAVDMLVQDIGSAAATEFTPSPDVGFYMAQNDLLDCQMGLIHSHNKMATFFSGTDQSTLSSEGADRNHFLSLIVNNEGTYTAKITRKIHYIEETTLCYEYNSFEDAPIQKNNLEIKTDKIVIEAFPLDIEKESRSFPDLDKTLEELRAKNAAKPVYKGFQGYVGYGKEKEVSAGPANVAQQKLPFLGETGKTKTVGSFPSKIEEGDEVYIENVESLNAGLREETIPYGKVKFNHKVIEELVRKILSANPLIGPNFKSEKFLKKMELLYDHSFQSIESFTEWAGNYIEFLLWDSEDPTLQKMGCSIEEEQAIMAHDLLEELDKFPENKYLTVYKEIIDAYVL